MSIKNLPKHLRPREKMLELGAANLSDSELLAILLRTGIKSQKENLSAIDLAQQILDKFSLSEIFKIPINQLIDSVKGISLAKAATLGASFELANRYINAQKISQKAILDSQVAYLLFLEIANEKKEHLMAIYLNGANEIINKKIIGIGLVDSSLIHPREVFYPAISSLAAKVIIAHNHPNGDTKPSESDVKATKQLLLAGQILDIELVDHLVVSSNGYFSFADNALVFEE
jgi:DNA repair protein RadC